MSETREFPTLDVASCTTGLLVSDRGVSALYEVLGYVLEDNLMTHQLPAAATAAEPLIFEQHPWMKDLDPPRDNLPALKAWCAALVAERGETMTLRPAADVAAWKGGNALQDLLDIAGKRPVLGIQL